MSDRKFVKFDGFSADSIYIYMIESIELIREALHEGKIAWNSHQGVYFYCQIESRFIFENEIKEDEELIDEIIESQKKCDPYIYERIIPFDFADFNNLKGAASFSFMLNKMKKDVILGNGIQIFECIVGVAEENGKHDPSIWPDIAEENLWNLLLTNVHPLLT